MAAKPANLKSCIERVRYLTKTGKVMPASAAQERTKKKSVDLDRLARPRPRTASPSSQISNPRDVPIIDFSVAAPGSLSDPFDRNPPPKRATELKLEEEAHKRIAVDVPSQRAVEYNEVLAERFHPSRLSEKLTNAIKGQKNSDPGKLFMSSNFASTLARSVNAANEGPDEWAEIMKPERRAKLTSIGPKEYQAMRQLFTDIDDDGNGYLELHELIAYRTANPKRLARDIFTRLAVDEADGRVYFDDFISVHFPALAKASIESAIELYEPKSQDVRVMHRESVEAVHESYDRILADEPTSTLEAFVEEHKDDQIAVIGFPLMPQLLLPHILSSTARGQPTRERGAPRSSRGATPSIQTPQSLPLSPGVTPPPRPRSPNDSLDASVIEIHPQPSGRRGTQRMPSQQQGLLTTTTPQRAVSPEVSPRPSSRSSPRSTATWGHRSLTGSTLTAKTPNRRRRFSVGPNRYSRPSIASNTPLSPSTRKSSGDASSAAGAAQKLPGPPTSTMNAYQLWLTVKRSGMDFERFIHTLKIHSIPLQPAAVGEPPSGAASSGGSGKNSVRTPSHRPMASFMSPTAGAARGSSLARTPESVALPQAVTESIGGPRYASSALSIPGSPSVSTALAVQTGKSEAGVVQLPQKLIEMSLLTQTGAINVPLLMMIPITRRQFMVLSMDYWVLHQSGGEIQYFNPRLKQLILKYSWLKLFPHTGEIRKYFKTEKDYVSKRTREKEAAEEAAREAEAGQLASGLTWLANENKSGAKARSLA